MQRSGAESRLIFIGQLHIPYVKHYSTLTRTSSCGAKPFQLVITNGLTDSEHLDDILSVSRETEHWWESRRQAGMKKKMDKKQEDIINTSVCTFKL